MKNENLYITFGDLIKEYLTEKDLIEFNQILEQKIDSEINLIAGRRVDYFGLPVEDDRSRSIRRFQIESLITFAENKLDKSILLDLLLSLGKVSNDMGEYDIAENLFKKIISESKDNKLLEEVIAYAKVGLSDVYINQAFSDRALAELDDARVLFTKSRDLFGLAKCENITGVVYGEKGDIHEAREHFIEALSLLDYNQHQHMQAAVQHNLAITEIQLTNYDSAIASFYRSLKYFERNNDEKAIASIRHNIANVYFKKGKFDLALKEAEISMTLAIKSGLISPLGGNYLVRSEISLSNNDKSLASAFANKSEDLSLQINDRFTIADIYRVKGQIHRELGEYKIAENHFLTSLRMNEELENKTNYAETSYELGLLYMKQNNSEESNYYLQRALDYNKSIGATKIIEKIEQSLQN